VGFEPAIRDFKQRGRYPRGETMDKDTLYENVSSLMDEHKEAHVHPVDVKDLSEAMVAMKVSLENVVRDPIAAAMVSGPDMGPIDTLIFTYMSLAYFVGVKRGKLG
jgi:hypothetical protein